MNKNEMYSFQNQRDGISFCLTFFFTGPGSGEYFKKMRGLFTEVKSPRVSWSRRQCAKVRM